jgi:hypothetical protein
MQCSGSGSVDTKGGHSQVMLVKVGLASFDGSGTGRSTLLLDRKITLPGPVRTQTHLPSRALILAR